ncbi:MAG TPA: acyl-CoA dehydrogenase family protein, partial [Candidatus Tectomicrobia bacterium]|nr:acyl-CoA dehydrogenase family protein [Candidatus Tectomicrobia bacterium]
MDFEYSEEQRLLADTLKRFLTTNYSLDARAKILASEEGYSQEVWAALAEMGLLGLPYDAEYGGFGGSAVDVMIVMEAIGEGLVLEPYLATVGLGGQVVARAGTEAQKRRILTAVAEGKAKLALAQTERGARYDLRHVATAARRAGAGWVLDGEKCAVLHGGCADLLIVPARTAGGVTDPRGISLFLVTQGTPGVTLREYRTIDNLRADDIRLSAAAVPEEALIGHEGCGLALLEEVVDYGTALLCAEAVGAI